MALFLFQYHPALADRQKRPQIILSQRYHYDLHKSNHEYYADRLSLRWDYLKVGIVAFFESQFNLDKNLWQRKEVGVELNKEVLSWFQASLFLQKSWFKEDYQYHLEFEKEENFESVGRVMFSCDLIKKPKFNMSGFVYNDYIYEFNQGAGICNEVVVGVTIPVGKYTKVGLNWRHIDRIHYYDSETIESSLTLSF